MDGNCKDCYFANHAREKALEAYDKAERLNERVNSLEKLAATQEVLNEKLDSLSEAVEEIKAIPGKILVGVTVPLLVAILIAGVAVLGK